MKSNFIKYVALALVLLTLIAVGACRPAPAQPWPHENPLVSPSGFAVVSLDITPPEVTAGETVAITAVVENIGGSEGTYTAVLTVDGATVETKEVALAAGTSKTVSFSLVKDKPGTYQVGIGGLTSSLKVIEEKPLVLFDESHGVGKIQVGPSAVSMTVDDGYRSLASLLSNNGFDVKPLSKGPITEEILSNASVFLLHAYAFTTSPLLQSEIESIEKFVNRGGGLLLLGESGYMQDNALAGKFGISLLPFVVCDPTDSTHVQPFHLKVHNFASHEITNSISGFQLDWGQPLTVHPPAFPLAFGDEDCWTENDYNGVKNEGEYSGEIIVAAASTYGNGRVVVVGDSSAFANLDPINYVGLLEYDTRRFALNIFAWLSQRPPQS